MSHDINSMAREFHNEHARQPLENLRKYNGINHDIITKLQRGLGSQLCERLEFTGSAYEGTQIGPDVEFDVMMIRRRDGAWAEPNPNYPGFVYLKRKASMFSSAEVLEPWVIMQKFKGEVQKVLNKMVVPFELKLREHGGPAIQLDVSSGDGTKYSVDLVPTYEIGDKYYVAKPLKDETLPGENPGNVLNLWRQSASPNEKKSLVDADRDNGCRKQVFRICKGLRVREPSLKPALSSVILKNALLHEMNRWFGPSWRPACLAERTIDVLGRVADSLDEGKLQKYFVPEVNLLLNMSTIKRNNMRDRLRQLIRKPKKLFALYDPCCEGDEDQGGASPPSEEGWCSLQ